MSLLDTGPWAIFSAAGSRQRAVGAQVAKATAGSRLPNYTQAEDRSKFWFAPANDLEAYQVAGYWLAVASRIAGNREPLALASRYQVLGSAMVGVPGAGMATGGVQSILASAVSYVKRLSMSSSDKSAILTILQSAQDVGRQQIREDYKTATGVEGRFVEPLVTTATDPFNTDALPDWLKRWKWYAIGGFALLLVVTLVAGTSGGRRAAAAVGRKGYAAARKGVARGYAGARRRLEA